MQLAIVILLLAMLIVVLNMIFRMHRTYWKPVGFLQHAAVLTISGLMLFPIVVFFYIALAS